jgi:hypothetical protein
MALSTKVLLLRYSACALLIGKPQPDSDKENRDDGQALEPQVSASDRKALKYMTGPSGSRL